MKKKLTWKETLLTGLTLFGLFFGAGNLIFPVHMGQLAGRNVWPAIAGFCVTAVSIPILGVAAIGVTHSDGLEALAKKAGKTFGTVFTCALYLTIGPLFAIPRCATTSFTTGVSPMLASPDREALPLLLFTAAFFALVLFFSLRPSGIVTWVGKIITPVFLVFFAVLVFAAMKDPSAAVRDVLPAAGYESGALFKGVLEGYGTMDAIAGLAFGIIVIRVIRACGVTDAGDIARNTLVSGLVAGALMAAIYVITTLMGTESRGTLEISENGGIALVGIAKMYFGRAGLAILAATITAACLKTAIGLVTSCAETFVKLFSSGPSYKAWAVVFTAFSFAISNVGLSRLIGYSVPVLMLLYPPAMVLILLAFFDKWFGGARCVYGWTLAGAIFAAVFDFLKTLPVPVEPAFAAKLFPFFDLGLGWVVPAAVGLVIGLLVRRANMRREKQ